MSFVDDYFDYQREACKKYGPDKTIVFIQKGDFYESYQKYCFRFGHFFLTICTL